MRRLKLRVSLFRAGQRDGVRRFSLHTPYEGVRSPDLTGGDLKNQVSLLWSRIRGRGGSRSGSTASIPLPPRPDAPIPVLLAVATLGDRLTIQQFLQSSRFVAVAADGLQHACRLASHIAFPLVIYDPFFDAGDDPTAFRRSIAAWRTPSVVLLCDADATAEATHGTGLFRHSTLSRPLQKAALIGALDSAYLLWLNPAAAQPTAPAGPVAQRSAAAH